VFSDVHGNYTALAQVWDELRALDLTGRQILNAGDSVGYGAEPERCVRFLQEHGNIISVRGNYDRNVASFPKKQEEYRKRWGRSRPEKYEAIKQDSDVISDLSRMWLSELPKEVRLTLQGVRIVVCHYSPGSKESLGSWTPQSAFAEIAGTADADVVVCGHTHTPFIKTVNNVLFLNPGTVGRISRYRCTYAILELDTASAPRAELRRI